MQALRQIVGSITWALRSPLAGDAVLLTGSHYLAAGFGFITTVVSARLLGPADYGVVALCFAYPSLLWSFVSLKSISMATRYIAGLRAEGREREALAVCKLGYAADLLASILAASLVLVTGGWVATAVYRVPEAWRLMAIYAASLPFFSLIGTSHAVFSALEEFRWLAAFQALERASVLVLVLAALGLGLGVPGVVLGTAVAHALNGVASLAAATYLLRRHGLPSWWRAPFGAAASIRGELARFFGWNYLQTTLTGALEQAPMILLGSLRSPQEAGFYRIASSLATVAAYPETSLGKMVYPRLSARWARGERGALRQTLRRWTLRCGLPVSALALVALVVMPLVVSLLFGSDYRRLVPAAQLLLGTAVVSAVFFWLASFYYAAGRVRLWTLAHGVFAAVVIGLAWPCIRAWGFLGMAGLFAAGKVVLVLWLATRVHRERATPLSAPTAEEAR